MEQYDISADLAEKIYRGKPENLTRQGLQYLGKANNAMGDMEGCSRYLAQAERILLAARERDT